MTVAYWCVLIAAYIPILWTALAKFSGSEFGDAENRAPRRYLEGLSGWRRRAHWAQLNAFEAFPPFAAAVIIAHLQKVPQSRVDALALAFVFFRFLHGIFYLADRGYWRSTAWFGAVCCVIALFIQSA